jgi:hypothetical protein
MTNNWYLVLAFSGFIYGIFGTIQTIICIIGAIIILRKLKPNKYIIKISWWTVSIRPVCEEAKESEIVLEYPKKVHV